MKKTDCTGQFAGTREEMVEHTPNGREIRMTAMGRFAVQPRNDNYWIECATLEDARRAFEHPEEFRLEY